MMMMVMILILLYLHYNYTTTTGIPTIKFSWATFTNDSIYSPDNLYGINPVPLPLIVKMRPSTVVQTRGDVRIARENVLEFLKAQLLLGKYNYYYCYYYYHY